MKIRKLKLKSFNEVEAELFEDEYEMCEEIYNHLKTKTFYEVKEGYVAVDSIKEAKEIVMSAYEKAKKMNLSIEEKEELEAEIEYLNGEDAVDVLIEEFDIFKFPSFLLG